MLKAEQKHLRLVHSDILSGQQEAEIIEYCNWQDGQFGLKSNLGDVAAMLRQGLFGITFSKDPERQLIKILDMTHRHRVVHRAMLAIGPHARVLAAAYVIARKPAYLEKQFGRLSGVAISLAEDVEALAVACRRRALGHKDQEKRDRQLVADYRVESQRLYSRAVRAYQAALLAARAEVVPTAPRVIVQVAHRCRISKVYPCPCGAAQ